MPEPKPEALAAWSRAVDAASKLFDAIDALEDLGADASPPFRPSVKARALDTLRAAHEATGAALAKLEGRPPRRPGPRPTAPTPAGPPAPPLRGRVR